MYYGDENQYFLLRIFFHAIIFFCITVMRMSIILITVMRTKILLLLNYGDVNYLFLCITVMRRRISVYCGNKNENVFHYCNLSDEKENNFFCYGNESIFLRYSNVNVWKVCVIVMNITSRCRFTRLSL